MDARWLHLRPFKQGNRRRCLNDSQKCRDRPFDDRLTDLASSAITRVTPIPQNDGHASRNVIMRRNRDNGCHRRNAYRCLPALLSPC